MALVDKFYRWLMQGPAPDCDRILAAAVGGAEAPYFDRIRDALFERGNEHAWGGLVGQWRRLPVDLQLRMQENRELLRAAIAAAMKSDVAEERLQAMTTFEVLLSVRLAYLVPVALRDVDTRVRDRAAAVLRELVATFVDRPRPGTDTRQELLQAYRNERAQLVRSVFESLRTFDLHHRLEVIETSLWLAGDLQKHLWEALEQSRSRAGFVVNENLLQWNNPRLARFLLLALDRPAWRTVALQVLRTWRTIPQLKALLAESDLLGRDEIRRNLTIFKSAAWFSGADEQLGLLPPELRVQAPRWICAMGLTENEKLASLLRWAQATCPELRRACVYALASFDTPAVMLFMEKHADSDAPTRGFARWYLLTHEAGVARLSARTEGEAPNPPPRGTPASQREFLTLWQLCRRGEPGTRAETIEIIREKLPAWSEFLRARLRSEDPRDRVLAMQVISTRELTQTYRHMLEELRSDPHESLQRLAGLMLSALDSAPPEPKTFAREPSAPTPSAPPKPQAARPAPLESAPMDLDVATARRELDAILRRLCTTSVDLYDFRLVQHVRRLFHRVHGPIEDHIRRRHPVAEVTS